MYVSRYPSGAEGTSVDNLLALNNLRRLKARATITDPVPLKGSDDLTKYGLVLGGVAGTLIPAGSLILTDFVPPGQFSLDADVTLAAAQNDVQSIFFSNFPDTGNLTLLVGGSSTPTPSISFQAEDTECFVDFFGGPATTGTYKITLTTPSGSLTTGFLNWNDPFTVIQAAVNALAGYSSVIVESDPSSGFIGLKFGTGIPNPTVTLTASTLDQVETIFNTVQSAFNSVVGFEGAQVVGSFSSGFVVTFAGSLAGTGVPLSTVSSSTLQMGSDVTNVKIQHTVEGHAARGVGSATCTTTGPVAAPAGALNVIGSPVSGWNTVTNQLDAIIGAEIESDKEALQRRSLELNAQANGPLQAIAAKLRKLTGVTAVAPFENVHVSALQKITFDAVPEAGLFQLIVGGGTTGNILFSANAAAVQASIRALSGLGSVVVTGTFEDGFLIDFDASGGNITQALIVVTGNTLNVSSVPVNTSVDFNRPGKSIELVVRGGADKDIATTIFNSKPGGIQTYGNTFYDVVDEELTTHRIYFSRPTEKALVISLTLVTDLATSAEPQFNPGSIADIQADLIAIVAKIPIGGLIVGFGSNGLIGAFNEVPGIVHYQLFFDFAGPALQNDNLQLLPGQDVVLESFNISVSYT